MGYLELLSCTITARVTRPVWTRAHCFVASAACADLTGVFGVVVVYDDAQRRQLEPYAPRMGRKLDFFGGRRVAGWPRSFGVVDMCEAHGDGN